MWLAGGMVISIESNEKQYENSSSMKMAVEMA